MKTLTYRIRWILKADSGMSATIQTFLSKVLILAINLATGIIVARTLGPAGRGDAAALGLWPQFLAYAMTLGLPSALLYNLKRYPDDKPRTFAAALILGTSAGIAAMIVGIIFIPQWLQQYSPEIIYAAQWLMVTAPIGLLSVILHATLEAEHNFTAANKFRYLVPLATLVGLVALILTEKITPLTVTLAYLLPGIPIFFWMLTGLWKNIWPHFDNLGKPSKRLLSYGIRSYGIDLLGTLSGQLDQVFVVGFLSPADMGLYAIALSMSRMLGVLFDSIITVLFPKTAGRTVDEVVNLTARAARVSLSLAFIAAVALFTTAPLFINVFYGQDYTRAIPVFRILLVEILLSATIGVLAQAFMALGRPGIPTILQGLGLGITIPLIFVLAPSYGLSGVASALLFSGLFRLALILFSYPVVLKVKVPHLLLTHEDIQYVRSVFRER